MTQPSSPVPQPVSPPIKKPFAYQASQVAFWGPIVALGIGLAANGALNGRSGDSMVGIAWIVIGGINVLILLASFVLGIVALIAAWRHNLKGIVGRTLIGMIISGVVLTAAASLPFVMSGARDRATTRLIGEWHATLHVPGGVVLDSALAMRPDRHATLSLSGGGKNITRTGTWNFRMGNEKQQSQLFIRWDPGQDPSLGDGVLWTVESINDEQLTLVGKNVDGSSATEFYQRVKPKATP